MDYYTNVIKKYAVFEGRAGRKEFWMFVLINLIISIAISIVESVLGLSSRGNPSVVSTLYALAVFVPSIAVGSRRLHDTGKSGWWQLIGLIPFIGAIVLIIFFVQPSEGSNAYGSGPDVVPTSGASDAGAQVPPAQPPVPPTVS